MANKEKKQWYCITAENFAVRVSKYQITYKKPPFAPIDFTNHAWKCNCEAYRFGYKNKEESDYYNPDYPNRKDCKHIYKAIERYCGWNSQIEDITPVLINGKPCCPKCGLPVRSVVLGK